MAASSSRTSSTTLQNSSSNSKATTPNSKTPSVEDIELENLDIENQTQSQEHEVAAPIPANRNNFSRAETKKFHQNRVFRAIQRLFSKTRADYFWSSVLVIWLLMAIIGLPTLYAPHWFEGIGDPKQQRAGWLVAGGVAWLYAIFFIILQFLEAVGIFKW